MMKLLLFSIFCGEIFTDSGGNPSKKIPGINTARPISSQTCFFVCANWQIISSSYYIGWLRWNTILWCSAYVPLIFNLILYLGGWFWKSNSNRRSAANGSWTTPMMFILDLSSSWPFSQTIGLSNILNSFMLNSQSNETLPPAITWYTWPRDNIETEGNPVDISVNHKFDESYNIQSEEVMDNAVQMHSRVSHWCLCHFVAFVQGQTLVAPVQLQGQPLMVLANEQTLRYDIGTKANDCGGTVATARVNAYCTGARANAYGTGTRANDYGNGTIANDWGTSANVQLQRRTLMALSPEQTEACGTGETVNACGTGAGAYCGGTGTSTNT